MLPDEMIAQIELMERFDPDAVEDELADMDDGEIEAALAEPEELRL